MRVYFPFHVEGCIKSKFAANTKKPNCKFGLAGENTTHKKTAEIVQFLISK